MASRNAAILEALPLAAAVLRMRKARAEAPFEAPAPAPEVTLWTPLAGPQQQALDSEADEVYYGGGAGGGKALSLDTRIPTADGWATMGDIEVGDVVFDERGLPCNVTATTEVMHGHRVYEVVFDDGTTIRADAEHSWLTYSYAERKALARRTAEARAARRATRPRRSGGARPDLAARNSATPTPVLEVPVGTVRTTEEIAASLTARRGTHLNHAVPVALPLDLPAAPLPVAPYTLGAWLGDGTRTTGSLTCADDEILDAIRADGYVVSRRAGAYQYGILGLVGGLRRLDLIDNKHIPLAYQRASYEQRLALLQGIVDTDGHVTERGAVEIILTNLPLMRDVWRLLMTLGIRATVTEGRATLNGRDCGPKYRVKFTTTQPVARLPRKADRLPLVTRATTRWRYIVSVRPVASVPVRCISVDSPSRLYLASEALVPTHNSFLLLGYGLTRARFGIVFRRQFKQLLGPEGLIETSKTIVGAPGAFNNSTLIWRLGQRQLEFGACDHEDDRYKYQGRAHDFKGFDEVAQFSEAQYLYLSGWARTTALGQRVRIIACGNPPQNTEGEWVIARWAAWLDEEHPHPAAPGELRYYVRTREGNEVEVPDTSPVTINNEVLHPRSRTFIPARVEDNPYLVATNYLAQLQQLPEPLRSQLIYGDHRVGLSDDDWQVIPAAWVRSAQARWVAERPPGVALDQIGVDVAQGGSDRTVLVRRYGTWFSEPEVHPGRTVPDAAHNAAHVSRALLEGGVAQIDSDGLGAATYHLLAATQTDTRVQAYRGSSPSKARDRSRVLTFANTRAAAWWAMRDALDPAYGSKVALPPSRELRADLCSARYEKLSNGIKIEAKDDIKERLGRSPDLGDAYVMANWAGDRVLSDLLATTRDTGPTDPPATQKRPDPLLRRRQTPVDPTNPPQGWPEVIEPSPHPGFGVLVAGG